MAAPPPAGASVAYQPPPISISELLDSKLGADWSAAKFSRFVERSRLQELLSGDVLRLLDRPLRLRLLLACLLAPQRAVEECREELSALAKRCAEGDCEWAAFYAAAAGRFGGQLELPPSEGRFRELHRDLDALAAELASSSAPALYPGEEHLALRGAGPLPDVRHGHFRLREGTAYATCEPRLAALAAAQASEAAGEGAEATETVALRGGGGMDSYEGAGPSAGGSVDAVGGRGYVSAAGGGSAELSGSVAQAAAKRARTDDATLWSL